MPARSRKICQSFLDRSHKLSLRAALPGSLPKQMVATGGLSVLLIWVLVDVGSCKVAFINHPNVIFLVVVYEFLEEKNPNAFSG